MSLTSPLKRQIDFTTAPDAVSSDFIGSRHASIVDAGATKVDGDNAILYLWYDNEFGYSCQVIRVMDHLAGTQRPALPTTSHTLTPARVHASQRAPLHPRTTTSPPAKRPFASLE